METLTDLRCQLADAIPRAISGSTNNAIWCGLNRTHLRQYSHFLYLHIHRHDYGWDTGEGRIRVPKEKLKFARLRKSNRSLKKLTERHLTKHLRRVATYYYTGSHNKHRRLLLCIDIDAHDGESDALEVAKYLNHWWLDGTGYIEPSTHGRGIHLYFIVNYPEFTSSKRLKTLFHELLMLMRQQVVWEGYQAKVCMIGGLPSDWANDTMATLIKLPRPQTENELKALINMRVMTLKEIGGFIERNQKEHPSFCSVAPTAAVPLLPSPSSCIMIVTDKGSPSKEATAETIKIPNRNIEEIMHRNPLYRALWTVRTLSHVLGRMPTVMEALDLYDRLRIGTGTITERRVVRFQQVVEYTSRTYDPSKRKSFESIYPVLKLMVEKAMAKYPQVSLTFQSRKDREASAISVESLVVGYYFSLYQLGKAPDGTLPIAGIVALNMRFLKDKVVTGKIANQKASAIRRILVELGLLEVLNEDYSFGWGRGKAKKYKLCLCQSV